MDIDVARKLIQNYIPRHAEFVRRAETAERYYRVQNDILFKKRKEDVTETPLRNADNRIPHPFYQLLVNQKAAYMFTAPPTFDIGNDSQDQAITKVLGDAYGKKMKDICVNASNTGIGWIHYWINDGEFDWAVVPSVQVIPVWSKKLNHELLAILRVYIDIDDDGKIWDVYEYWNDVTCCVFHKLAVDDFDQLTTYTDFFNSGDMSDGSTYAHGLTTIPFIPFLNNSLCTSDLDPVKALIDSYDKTYSGFVNDLEDIQEVIFILTNYGGEDLNQFMRDMKYYKTIMTDSVSGDDKSGVSTLTIDIPVDAREKMLTITRKAIFDLGQGIDPQQQGLDGTSGEAMKFLYALLELKAGLMETEFRLGFNKFVRAIAAHVGIGADAIIQTWTRSAIRNDAELVDMCSKSSGIISKKTILKNHPFVDNAEEELQRLADEEAEATAKDDIYGGSAIDDTKGGDVNVQVAN
ncbi:phage portal protein [Megasphaera vaginalis (ex Srinivasan et al. 2021)]|uniref:SPP1 Gp6-like phage portal protein n=1 Tax=Megasphaera vaginalis (ex Srinivasan et al. 2021) TaxID=1111454 RepID=U7UIU7_9FIRM|nr:phage portal protein [Megasphaera vaginalis (ex Srinivasan et al. 2021)]ERT59342.1 SPP1 Gp6-like phage portal protein [Megasphaera vaginalis (ex Srinivasan et al. 2021)]